MPLVAELEELTRGSATFRLPSLVAAMGVAAVAGELALAQELSTAARTPRQPSQGTPR